LRAALKVHDGPGEARGDVGAVRDHHLGRRRRRRGPAVGDVIADGDVGFVPDGGHDRHERAEDGAGDAFLIEGHSSSTEPPPRPI
jgi:hypothetical protein